MFACLEAFNLEVSDKFPLMFIGNYWRPRVFMLKYGQTHGLDHHINKNSWKKTSLLHAYLNDYVKKCRGENSFAT